MAVLTPTLREQVCHQGLIAMSIVGACRIWVPICQALQLFVCVCV